jgi:hypothetical protein
MSTAITATMSDAEQTRESRAANEHVTLVGVFGDDFIFDFAGSDETHAVHTSGSDAEMCTCPDHQHRGVRCKHMAAFEDFSHVDEFDF